MPKLVHRERVPSDIAAKILAFIRAGNTIKTAALCAGIQRDTFYDWMNRGAAGERGYVEFARDVERAKAEAEALMVSRLRAVTDPVEAGDAKGGKKAKGKKLPAAWQAICWWLERRNREEWGRTDKLALTGPSGGPVQTVDVTKLTDEELRKLLDTIEGG